MERQFASSIAKRKPQTPNEDHVTDEMQNILRALETLKDEYRAARHNPAARMVKEKQIRRLLWHVRCCSTWTLPLHTRSASHETCPMPCRTWFDALCHAELGACRAIPFFGLPVHSCCNIRMLERWKLASITILHSLLPHNQDSQYTAVGEF